MAGIISRKASGGRSGGTTEMMEDAFWDLAMHDLAIRDLHDVVQRLQHEVQVLEERVQRLESGRYAFMECSER
jgi:hypothetical protein